MAAEPVKVPVETGDPEAAEAGAAPSGGGGGAETDSAGATGGGGATSAGEDAGAVGNPPGGTGRSIGTFRGMNGLISVVPDVATAEPTLRVGLVVAQSEVTIGGGHVSGERGWLHYGIGDASNARVRVHWPNGDVGPWLTVGADYFATIRRGETSATAWRPPS